MKEVPFGLKQKTESSINAHNTTLNVKVLQPINIDVNKSSTPLYRVLFD